MSLVAFCITSGDPLALYPRGEWSSEHYRCDGCKYVGRAIIDSRRDECRTRPDHVAVCPKCTDEDLTECNYSCDRCQHAECMDDDSICYTCAVAEELDEVSVVPRYQRAREREANLPSLSEHLDELFREMAAAHKVARP